MRPKGLEPPAHCLEGSCSIQLSYGRTWFLTPLYGNKLRLLIYHTQPEKSSPIYKKYQTFAEYTPTGGSLFTKYSSYHRMKE